MIRQNSFRYRLSASLFFGALGACTPTPTEQAPKEEQTLQPKASWSQALLDAHSAGDKASSNSARLDAAQSMEKLAFAADRPQKPAATLLAQELVARASRLYLAAGQATRALPLVQRGLDLSAEPTVARAELLMILADCQNAVGNTELERAALLQALSVHELLFKKELNGP
jgi:hypothetical protein